MRKRKNRQQLELQIATEIVKLLTALIALLTALVHFMSSD